MALSALDGVGDPKLGQWIEQTFCASHVRRRLTHREAGGMTLRDIRGTLEERTRLLCLAEARPELLPFITERIR